MLFNGFYINLIAGSPRDLSMQAEIAKCGLNGRLSRFQAIRGTKTARLTAAEAGCLMSHYSIIRDAPRDKHLLILEDDIVLPREFTKHLDLVLANLQPSLDMIFLGSLFNYHNLIVIKSWLNLVSRLDLAKKLKNPDKFFFLNSKDWYSAGGHAYLLNNNRLDKIKTLIEQSVSSGANENIDEIYFRAIKTDLINANIIFPFIVGLNDTLDSHTQERNSKEEQRLYGVSSNVFSVAVAYDDLLRQVVANHSSEDFDLNAFLFGHIATQRLIS
jgi:GR25 family glycosyltransferase involved in LPS biosynthesis